jgi:hypothetical protein
MQIFFPTHSNHHSMFYKLTYSSKSSLFDHIYPLLPLFDCYGPFVYVVLGIEPRTLWLLGRYSTTCPTSPALP